MVCRSSGRFSPWSSLPSVTQKFQRCALHGKWKANGHLVPNTSVAPWSSSCRPIIPTISLTIRSHTRENVRPMVAIKSLCKKKKVVTTSFAQTKLRRYGGLWLHSCFGSSSSLRTAAVFSAQTRRQNAGGVPNLRERHGRLSVAHVGSLPTNRQQRKKIFLTDSVSVHRTNNIPKSTLFVLLSCLMEMECDQR